MELVVRAQSRQCPSADTVGEENLRGSVDPWARCEQLLPSGRDVVKQTVVGAVQRHRSSQKNEKHHVGEQGWKPDDLTALMQTTPDDKVNEQPADNQTTQELPLHPADAFDTGGDPENPSSKISKVTTGLSGIAAPLTRWTLVNGLGTLVVGQ